MDQFIGQVRDAYKQLELLGSEHCETGSYEKLDYEGRVLILSPNTLKEVIGTSETSSGWPMTASAVLLAPSAQYPLHLSG